MKRAFSWKRALLIAAALTVAGQARALGGESGVGGSGTGGPPLMHQISGPTDAPKVSPTGSSGVPTWYAVDGTSAEPRKPTPIVDRSLPVPQWYAIS